jgi:hypothetical protein
MGMESGLVHAYEFSLRGRSRSLLPNQVLHCVALLMKQPATNEEICQLRKNLN